MENEYQIVSEPTSDPEFEVIDSPSVDSNHDDILAELESLRESNRTLQSKSEDMEETLVMTKRQRDDAFREITNLSGIIDDLSSENDCLHRKMDEAEESFRVREEDYVKTFEENFREGEALRIEIQVYREKFETFDKERGQRREFLVELVDSVRVLKEGLMKFIESVDGENVIKEADCEILGLYCDSDSRLVKEEIIEVKRLLAVAESKLGDYKEVRKNEKKQLENSVVSLTEENRDVSSLLRIALVEKEAVEKSLNKLKGHSEQKRGALLSFTGLQRVGFGFIMGSGGNIEQVVENSGVSTKSDESEFEEEVGSLASTVEKIMKNLRLEISQLRRSLEETRSDNERLQILTDKQGEEIAGHMMYIKDLEERERLFAQNVEELLYEIKEAETDVARWREACELEVEAGKTEISERDEVVVILQNELEKTKAALEISNGKLKLKEDLTAAAMAAQAAAEASLQLTDGRASGLRERIEELTRQLEEAENRERQKARHICWPWRVIAHSYSTNVAAAPKFPDIKRVIPEMQALLHYSV